MVEISRKAKIMYKLIKDAEEIDYIALLAKVDDTNKFTKKILKELKKKKLIEVKRKLYYNDYKVKNINTSIIVIEDRVRRRLDLGHGYILPLINKWVSASIKIELHPDANSNHNPEYHHTLPTHRLAEDARIHFYPSGAQGSNIQEFIEEDKLILTNIRRRKTGYLNFFERIRPYSGTPTKYTLKFSLKPANTRRTPEIKQIVLYEIHEIKAALNTKHWTKNQISNALGGIIPVETIRENMITRSSTTERTQTSAATSTSSPVDHQNRLPLINRWTKSTIRFQPSFDSSISPGQRSIIKDKAISILHVRESQINIDHDITIVNIKSTSSTQMISFFRKLQRLIPYISRIGSSIFIKLDHPTENTPANNRSRSIKIHATPLNSPEQFSTIADVIQNRGWSTIDVNHVLYNVDISNYAVTTSSPNLEAALEYAAVGVTGSVATASNVTEAGGRGRFLINHRTKISLELHFSPNHRSDQVFSLVRSIIKTRIADSNPPERIVEGRHNFFIKIINWKTSKNRLIRLLNGLSDLFNNILLYALLRVKYHPTGLDLDSNLYAEQEFSTLPGDRLSSPVAQPDNEYLINIIETQRWNEQRAVLRAERHNLRSSISKRRRKKRK